MRVLYLYYKVLLGSKFGVNKPILAGFLYSIKGFKVLRKFPSRTAYNIAYGAGNIAVNVNVVKGVYIIISIIVVIIIYILINIR